MLKWKSRVPKNRKKEGYETAIKMIVYPPVIAGALLFGVPKKRRSKNRRKKK